MRIEKIKPIPKYIEKLIRKEDKNIRAGQQGRVRFYAYFTKNDDELVKVTVAVKNKYQTWYCKQVAVHGVHSNVCFVRDIEYSYMGGYMVSFHDVCIRERKRNFEDGVWYVVDDKYFDPFAVPVNMKYVLKQKEYKYSAADQVSIEDTFKYLRLYEQYPEGEYLIKLGFSHYATSKIILRKLHTDQQFRTWLIRNRKELLQRHYYVGSWMRAFKLNKPCAKIQLETENKRNIKNSLYRAVLELFENDSEKLLAYLNKQDASVTEYNDYLRACQNLGLDMNLPKNKIPHDFRRWHDIRIDEYATLQAIEDEKRRQELLEQFVAVAEKYLTLQQNGKDAYVVIIAKTPYELVEEGKALNHCVGRMGYDQRFAREESLIFFVRDKDSPEIPLATMEYSIKQHKILQCYGYHDTRPQQRLLDYVNKTWLPYANKKIKQIAA